MTAGDCGQTAHPSAAGAGGGSSGGSGGSIPGCSSQHHLLPPYLNQIRWKSSRHGQLREMTFLNLKQRSRGLHLVANAQDSAHAELSLETRGSGQASVPAAACAGCRSSIAAAAPSPPALLAIAASLSAFHTLPSHPAPKPGFLTRLRGRSSHSGDAGDGAGFGTPIPALPSSGGAGGAAGAARLQSPPALSMLHYITCITGWGTRGCGAGSAHRGGLVALLSVAGAAWGRAAPWPACL